MSGKFRAEIEKIDRGAKKPRSSFSNQNSFEWVPVWKFSLIYAETGKTFTFFDFLQVFVLSKKLPLGPEREAMFRYAKGVVEEIQKFCTTSELNHRYNIEFAPFSLNRADDSAFEFYLVPWLDNPFVFDGLNTYNFQVASYFLNNKVYNDKDPTVKSFVEECNRSDFIFSSRDILGTPIPNVKIVAAKPLIAKQKEGDWMFESCKSPPLTMSMLINNSIQRFHDILNNLAMVIMTNFSTPLSENSKTIWINSHCTDYPNLESLKVGLGNHRLNPRYPNKYWAWFRVETDPCFIISYPLRERLEKKAHQRISLGMQSVQASQQFPFCICPKMYKTNQQVPELGRRDDMARNFIKFVYERRGDLFFNGEHVKILERIFNALDKDGNKSISKNDFDTGIIIASGIKNKTVEQSRWERFDSTLQLFQHTSSQVSAKCSEENFILFGLFISLIGASWRNPTVNFIVTDGHIFKKKDTSLRKNFDKKCDWVTRLCYFRECFLCNLHWFSANFTLWLDITLPDLVQNVESDYATICSTLDDHFNVINKRAKKRSSSPPRNSQKRSVGPNLDDVYTITGASFAAGGGSNSKQYGGSRSGSYGGGGGGGYNSDDSAGQNANSDDEVTRYNGETDSEMEFLELLMDDEDHIWLSKDCHNHLRHIFDNLRDKSRSNDYIDADDFRSPHNDHLNKLKQNLWKKLSSNTDFDMNGQVEYDEFKRMFLLLIIRSKWGTKSRMEAYASHIYSDASVKYPSYLSPPFPLYDLAGQGRHVQFCDKFNKLEDSMMCLREKNSMYCFLYTYIFEKYLEGDPSVTENIVDEMFTLLNPDISQRVY